MYMASIVFEKACRELGVVCGLHVYIDNTGFLLYVVLKVTLLPNIAKVFPDDVAADILSNILFIRKGKCNKNSSAFISNHQGQNRYVSFGADKHP